MENYARDYGDEYAFGEDVEFEIHEIKHNIRPKSNQSLKTETTSACTIIWAMNQIIRLFWLDLSKNETNELWVEIVHYCEQYWYRIGSWRDTPLAIKYVCKFRNEIWAERYWTEKVFYARHYRNTEKPKEALEKWHLVWFTYHLNFWDDRKKWLVYKEEYPWWVWHRTNRQATKTTKPTWWASEPTADCWVYDSFYWLTNQYLIRDRSKYMNKWMYARAYMIMPESRMKKNIEEEKEKIAQKKAMNYVLWALSCAYESVDVKYQEKFWELARMIRDDYQDVRWIETNTEKKWAIALTDALSYLWKYANDENKKNYSELAMKNRKEYDFE